MEYIVSHLIDVSAESSGRNYLIHGKSSIQITGASRGLGRAGLQRFFLSFFSLATFLVAACASASLDAFMFLAPPRASNTVWDAAVSASGSSLNPGIRMS
ncbi:hypothetical protein SeMB42_g06454 [Synchytrium endobioticum]|uniref:Uncharacterized protein n=1 Tax=Synchytrium endobioticum TaxID=286115 RepID=A0A507CLQ0_9FUNG|nr:hypothetical protein SeMB42_g06454 [Synchytrium endobioticum]